MQPIFSILFHRPSASAHLTVTPVGLGVLALPGVTATGLGVVVAVSLVDTTGLLAGSGETTRLTVLLGIANQQGHSRAIEDFFFRIAKTAQETHLVDGLADPVNTGIAANSLVLRVNADDLEVLVGGVLVDPVGVQDTQVGAAAANTLFSSGAQSTLVLELVDTLVGGLAVGGTLGNRALAATAADTDAVDDVALLGLVAETTSLVGAGGARSTVDGVQLTELY